MPERIEWQAPEFHYYKKDLSWYGWVIVIGAVIILIALWQRNMLFAFFGVIAVIMIVVWGEKRPKTIRFGLDKNNLRIDGKDYSLKSFSGFTIEGNVLILRKKGIFGAYEKITLPFEKTGVIKGKLKPLMPEMEYAPSLIDEIARVMGF